MRDAKQASAARPWQCLPMRSAAVRCNMRRSSCDTTNPTDYPLRHGSQTIPDMHYIPLLRRVVAFTPGVSTIATFRCFVAGARSYRCWRPSAPISFCAHHNSCPRHSSSSMVRKQERRWPNGVRGPEVWGPSVRYCRRCRACRWHYKQALLLERCTGNPPVAGGIFAVERLYHVFRQQPCKPEHAMSALSCERARTRVLTRPPGVLTKRQKA